MTAETMPSPVREGTILTRTCHHCGVEYEWISEPNNQWPTNYCTKRCKRKGSVNRRVRLQSTRDAPDGMVLLICGRCERPFGWIVPADSTAAPPIVCSDTCRTAARKARRKARDLGPVKTVRDVERERVEAMAAAARELLLPASHCTSCGKVASPTREAAKEAKRSIEQQARRTNEVRYYECPAGWWHWTRMV